MGDTPHCRPPRLQRPHRLAVVAALGLAGVIRRAGGYVSARTLTKALPRSTFAVAVPTTSASSSKGGTAPVMEAGPRRLGHTLLDPMREVVDRPLVVPARVMRGLSRSPMGQVCLRSQLTSRRL